MGTDLPQRALWAWPTLAERLPGPRWLLPLALFITLYAVGGLIATAAGDTLRFYRDVR
jgi:hypothetical protein